MHKEFEHTTRKSDQSVLALRQRVSISEMQSILAKSSLVPLLDRGNEKLCFQENEQSCVAQIGDWFYYKLRDRFFDGPGWIGDALTEWHYGGVADCVSVPAVEESTYWLDPRGSICSRYSESDRRFIINPFEALPELSGEAEAFIQWNRRFERLIDDQTLPLPGHFSDISIPGLRRQILDRSLVVLDRLGYAQLTAVPTWFHTALLYEHLGFRYTDQSDMMRIEEIKEHLLGRRQLGRVAASWQMMRQFWAERVEARGEVPEKITTKGFVLRNDSGQIITYPLRPERNVWMYHWT